MGAHEGDDLTCFRRALAEGDRRHAAHHLAGLVAEGASPEARACLRDLLGACEGKADDPVELAPLGENVYFGTVVLRAILLAHAGRAHEGLPLVLRAQAVVPDVDLVAWTDGWLTDAAVAAIDIDDVVQGAFKISPHHPYTERVIQMLVRILSTREPHGSLALATARLVRLTGDLDRAISIAEDAHRRGPSYFTCVARGAAYREASRYAEAIAAYEDAVAMEPNDDAVRLDIGDLSIAAGDTERAARAYAEVLTRDPRHEWAWPSQLYLLARDGDEAARHELGRLSAGGNTRAQDLFAKLEPYLLDLRPPSASCVQIAHDAVARGAAPTSLAISSIEPPSAIATFRDVLSRRFDPSGVAIEVTIPTPDPRLPRAEVEWRVWTYEAGGSLGTMAAPALPAPREEVAGAIGELARTRYEPPGWSSTARDLAKRFGDAAVNDVLATFAFPPPAPEGAPLGEWRFRVQVAAAFVACRLGASSGAAWAPSLGGRAARTLLDGPLDWSTTAMIVALAELAREVPDLGAPIASLLAPHVVAPTSPIHYGCAVHPAVYCVLRIPAVADDVRSRALALRKMFDAED
ncbi:MAG: tetratricopeptide repeat protein [Deltaproteobacteria bacterium]|nr:tetratricopeptide repeat protein [Deltaproteobacteria bacterium]